MQSFKNQPASPLSILPQSRRAPGLHRRRFAGAFRRAGALLLAVCLLAPAAAGFVPKGDKNYKKGLQHEAAQQWEKAAEEFALAVAAEPSNAEYQLHYRRSVFNASQTFMQQGVALAERGDHLGAYNAFRRAYGYDPVNELARSMMERMLRLQVGKGDEGAAAEGAHHAPRATIAATRFEHGKPGGAGAPGGGDELAAPATRAEQLRVITYNGDLETFIKYLAKQLRLNAVFDRDFPRRNVDVDLSDVTAAQALDYIFLTQGLFFQKLSSRTILVADQSKRPQYQQLVLRTFYLYNIDPNDARALIQASIPPQTGRQPVITPNKATNSITVRDTPENVRLVGEILQSIDKDRAEVVMDVNIYEVSRTDLMQFGNQFGTGSTLENLGGITKGFSILGGSREVITRGAGAIAAPTALGAALIIPPTALSALERKDQTRLVASTQVHAFDGEKSTAHIGQRVPVQTASVTSFGSVGSGEGSPQQGVAAGLFGGNGYPVIQYEKTGLTLEFTPQVFPNLDVQVKMSIKSNDVSQSAAATLTPTFTERNIEGTARIQNNRTMMIASVAQNQQSRGRQGIPVLGLVPVLGRLFTAPRRNDQSTDIVIAVTPHVLRAPALTPRDEESRPTGTLQTPNTDTLEAMLQDASRDEQLAAARLIPRERVIELPDAGPPQSEAESPKFVPAPRSLSGDAAVAGDIENASAGGTGAPAVRAAPAVERPAEAGSVAATAVSTNFIKAEPAGQMAKTFDLTAETSAPPAETSAFRAEDTTRPVAPATPRAPTPLPAAGGGLFAGASAGKRDEASAVERKTVAANAGGPARSAASLSLMSEPQEMRVGERRRLRVLLKTDAPLGLVAATLHFDSRVIAVRSVTRGTMFGNSPDVLVAMTQTVSPEGVLLVSLAPQAGAPAITGAGVLMVIEVEALEAGTSAVSFSADDVHLLATDGRKILLKVLPAQISVK